MKCVKFPFFGFSFPSNKSASLSTQQLWRWKMLFIDFRSCFCEMSVSSYVITQSSIERVCFLCSVDGRLFNLRLRNEMLPQTKQTLYHVAVKIRRKGWKFLVNLTIVVKWEDGNQVFIEFGLCQTKARIRLLTKHILISSASVTIKFTFYSNFQLLA